MCLCVCVCVSVCVLCVFCVCVHVCLSIIKRVVGSVVHVIVLSHHVVERRLIVKLFNVVG